MSAMHKGSLRSDSQRSRELSVTYLLVEVFTYDMVVHLSLGANRNHKVGIQEHAMTFPQLRADTPLPHLSLLHFIVLRHLDTSDASRISLRAGRLCGGRSFRTSSKCEWHVPPAFQPNSKARQTSLGGQICPLALNLRRRVLESTWA